MRFDRLSRLVTYLLVATSFAVLLLSGELGPEFPFIFLPAYFLSIPLSRREWARSVRGWNAILVIGLLLSFVLAFAMGDWLRWAIFFASLMVTAKLYQQRSSTDFFQLYLLSFLQLVAGAVVNPTLLFAIAFLAYVVLLTWALVLLHLRRDLERVAAADGSSLDVLMGAPKLRRLVTPGFLGGTSLLALGIFFASIVVFLFFPRLGLGLFGAHRQSGDSVSGFSDSIELGGFGTIKSDQTVVMRVESDTPLEPLLPLRLKGMVFDKYDGRGWSKTTQERRDLRRTAEGEFFAVRREPSVLPEGALRYELRVFMEPIRMEKKAIFGEHRLVGVRDQGDDRYLLDPRRRTGYFKDSHDDVIYNSRSSDPLRYVVRSIRFPRDVVALRATGPVDSERMAEFLQLPASLDPRIPELARTITAGEVHPFDKVGAIERYLLANHTYSLAGGQDPDEPLADFLFGMKAGHCEFFSTALVVLARSIGIAARPAAGFYGGAYNSVGDFAAIRQADAHSWAEVFFPGEGWEVFDATPASGALVAAEEGFFARLWRLFDSLEMLWYKTVIRFDLDTQIEFLKDLGKRFGGLGKVLPNRREWRQFTKNIKHYLAPIAIATVSLVVVVGVGIWLWRRRRPKSTIVLRMATGRDARRARKLYRAVEGTAKKRGIELGIAMTPGRLLQALTAQNPTLAEDAAPVIRLYETVLFGGVALQPSELDAAKVHLKRMKSLR